MAGAPASTRPVTATPAARNIIVRGRIMTTSGNFCGCAKCNTRSWQPVPASEQTQQQMQAVDGAAGEAADDRAVDADVLQVVARVLLDQPHGALGPERPHAVLDEGGKAIVMALDQRAHLRLDPRVDLAPQLAIAEQREARAVEAIDQPRRHFRA